MEMNINLDVTEKRKSPMKCEITAIVKNVQRCNAKQAELRSPDFELLFPNVKWYLEVTKWHGNVSHNDYMSVDLYCSNDSPTFGCFARINFKLVSQREDTDDLNQETTVYYSKVMWGRGIREFANWKDIIDEEKGYLKDGEIILKVKVWAEAPYGGCWDSKRKTGYVGFAKDKLSPSDVGFGDYESREIDGNKFCYVSCVLQMLFFTKQLRDTALASGGDEKRKVTLALRRIFNELQFSEKAVNMNEFNELFDEISKSQRYEEYLRLIIDSLRRDTLATRFSDTISHLFEGKLKTVIKCDNNVIRESEVIESFFDVTLKVEENSDIYSALKEFVKVCKLEGDNRYDAGHHGLQKATKYTSFEKLPLVFHMHLARFQFDTVHKRTVKSNNRMEFYDEIDLTEFSNCKDGNDAKYRLHAVLVRSDQRFRTSHFLYVSPNVDGSWYRFDNEVVCEVSKSEAIEGNFECARYGYSRSAVMLVYVKQSELKHILQPVKEGDISHSCLPKRVCSEFPVNFTNFLNSNFASDISIIVGNGQSYKCHRVLLCNDSLFFETLNLDEKDGCHPFVDLQKYLLKSEAFEVVLAYIYGGTCDVTVRNVCDVFRVVAVLQIDFLRERCIEYVRKYKIAKEAFGMFKIARELGNQAALEAISSAIVHDNNLLLDFSVKGLDSNDMRYLLSRGAQTSRNNKHLLESTLKWVVGATHGEKYFSDLLREIDLNKISINNIKNLCNREYVVNFKLCRSRNFLFVPSLFDRFLTHDDNVVDPYTYDDVASKAIKNDDIGSNITVLRISKISADYSHLLRSDKFSDVTIRIGSRRFNCHRVLLAGSSPFFHAMFANANPIESSKEEVALNVDVEAFTQIIRLIYSGSFLISSKSVIKLANLSFFLQMKVACEKCVEFARSNMVLENLVDFYSLAYEHDIKDQLATSKRIVLANLQYVAAMGCLKNTSFQVLRFLLVDGEKYVCRPSHLLLAVLKWVVAYENRITHLPELLSVLDLSKMSTPDIRQIFNSCTDSDFRLSHIFEMSPILERFLQDENAVKNFRTGENVIYLVTMDENQFYYVGEWNQYSVKNNDNAIPKLSLENSMFDDYGKVDVQIAKSGMKIYALMKEKQTKRVHFAELIAKIVESKEHFNAINGTKKQPIFPPARDLSTVQSSFHVIPGMRNFTVFSDFGRAAFYIYDDAESSWKVHILREQPLFEKFDKLLVAGDEELIVLTGESDSHFKLVDLRVNSVINIPKPRVLKDDATITLFNHRLYLFDLYNDIRKSAMYDLFTNEWTLLPDLPGVSGMQYGRLQSIGLENCILVFETRQFDEGELDEGDDEGDGSNNDDEEVEEEGEEEVEEGEEKVEEEEEENEEVANEDESDDIVNPWYKCYVHRFDLITREWSSVGEIRAVVLQAIVANPAIRQHAPA